ncbi:MAG: zinc-dependent metalloprotease [Acidimicrobiales bacterium]
MTASVDWRLAQQVAARVGRREPFAQSYHYASLAPDFAELTAEAEELVAEVAGLRSLAGPARARVTDRAGWVDANIASFQRLLRPLIDKLEAKASGASFGGVAGRLAGLEVGALLGWMSLRVLGQYDVLIIEDERPEDQDLVYYVGPNVLSLEKRYAFPPREFRLWLAVHECTHRAQFTGVPWLRHHFLDLVQRTIDAVEPDPKRLVGALKAARDERRAGRRPLDSGLAALFATDEQRQLLDRIGGMMSLLEGHGDIVMNRAVAERAPSAERFARVLHARRQQSSSLVRLLQRLIGLDAKLAQYLQGEGFVLAVEAAGGRELFDNVWRGPEWLPTMDEIRRPEEWIERVRLSHAV